MNQAFERHTAYMAQAWRTLQDSVLLKENESNKSPYVGPHRDAEDIADMAGRKNVNPRVLALIQHYLNREQQTPKRTTQDSNIARVVANHPEAADRRHCQSQGCQAMVKPGNSYCAACLERGDATDAQGIDPEGNYGTGRNQ